MSSMVIQELGLLQPFEILRVDFSPAAFVTEHPTEPGFPVTDHIQVKPSSIVVTAMVSDTPLATGAVGGVAQAASWIDSAMGQSLSLTVDNVGVFRGYAIQDAPHSLTPVEGRRFVFRLRQIQIAESLSVPIPAGTTTSTGAESAQDAGQQTTTPTDPRPASFLRDIATILGV